MKMELRYDLIVGLSKEQYQQHRFPHIDSIIVQWQNISRHNAYKFQKQFVEAGVLI